MEHRRVFERQSRCVGLTRCSCGGAVLRLGGQSFRLGPAAVAELFETLGKALETPPQVPAHPENPSPMSPAAHPPWWLNPLGDRALFPGPSPN